MDKINSNMKTKATGTTEVHTTKQSSIYNITVYTLAFIGLGTVANTVRKGFMWVAGISKGRKKDMECIHTQK